MAHAAIRPGLERIARLLKRTEITWKAAHVAGTNGKGSICAYLSAMLHASKVPTGRFTSPHLIDRWDCITVNEKPVSKSLFLEVEEQFKFRNEKKHIEASSFELLTATAFEIFNREKVKVGVIECGMGGRHDATNVLQDKIVTVIGKLGMDHQAFLGDTPEAIAGEKAGIMRHGVPCVINSCSEAQYLNTLEDVAMKVNAPFYYTPLPVRAMKFKPSFKGQIPGGHGGLFEHMDRQSSTRLPAFTKDNMWCAWLAFKLMQDKLSINDVNMNKMRDVMLANKLPGRFQQLSLTSITGRKNPVVIDGAHNDDAWRTLARWFDHFYRQRSESVTWLVACSNGRDPMSIMKGIRPQDKCIAVEFGPVDSMPWVKPVPAAEFKPVDEDSPQWIDMGSDVHGALVRACHEAGEGPLLIAGSLYLVSDVLRIVRDGALDKSILGTGGTNTGSLYLDDDIMPAAEGEEPVSAIADENTEHLKHDVDAITQTENTTPKSKTPKSARKLTFIKYSAEPLPEDLPDPMDSLPTRATSAPLTPEQEAKFERMRQAAERLQKHKTRNQSVDWARGTYQDKKVLKDTRTDQTTDSQGAQSTLVETANTVEPGTKHPIIRQFLGNMDPRYDLNKPDIIKPTEDLEQELEKHDNGAQPLAVGTQLEGSNEDKLEKEKPKPGTKKPKIRKFAAATGNTDLDYDMKSVDIVKPTEDLGKDEGLENSVRAIAVNTQLEGSDEGKLEKKKLMAGRKEPVIRKAEATTANRLRILRGAKKFDRRGLDESRLEIEENFARLRKGKFDAVEESQDIQAAHLETVAHAEEVEPAIKEPIIGKYRAKTTETREEYAARRLRIMKQMKELNTDKQRRVAIEKQLERFRQAKLNAVKENQDTEAVDTQAAHIMTTANAGEVGPGMEEPIINRYTPRPTEASAAFLANKPPVIRKQLDSTKHDERKMAIEKQMAKLIDIKLNEAKEKQQSLAKPLPIEYMSEAEAEREKLRGIALKVKEKGTEPVKRMRMGEDGKLTTTYSYLDMDQRNYQSRETTVKEQETAQEISPRIRTVATEATEGERRAKILLDVRLRSGLQPENGEEDSSTAATQDGSPNVRIFKDDRPKFRLRKHDAGFNDLKHAFYRAKRDLPPDEHPETQRDGQGRMWEHQEWVKQS